MPNRMLLALYLTAALMGSSVPAAEVPGRLDSDAARIYLRWLSNPSSALPRELAVLDRHAASSTLDRDELQMLTRHHSVDLATLLFARSILAQPDNAALRATFDAELAKVQQRPTLARASRPDHPTVVFVPGFLYRSHPETGGDFAIPRQQLSSLGISNLLIETDEAGSVDGNAGRIAAVLRARADDSVVLVSASKAGPEVALALGRLLDLEETRSVVAWINIGGLLGGTPLADQALAPPQRWLVRVALWWKGVRVDGVRSLRTTESRRRLADLSLPADLPIINVVAAPLGGDLSRRAAGGYRKLRSLGPNDGLALLADQIPPRSRTLVQLGDDHFFTRQDPHTMTLALLQTARHVIDSTLDDRASTPHRTPRFVQAEDELRRAAHGSRWQLN